ncbi:PH domain-containing protein [Clostridium sp.]|uniref:PH domain-containing protein n=1 Tax=Clostridium sp. TaxID=1506 RepID=UPI0034648364
MLKEKSRNHFLYIIEEIVKGLKAWLIFIFIGAAKWGYIFGVVGVLFLIIIPLISWCSIYFYLEDNTLVYISGILSKEKREIPFNKISTVDIQKTVIDRMFNICTVKIDTGIASINGSEFKIKLSHHMAMALKEIILEGRKYEDNINKDESIDKEDVHQVLNKDIEDNKIEASFKDILMYSLTKNKLIWSLSVFFIITEFLENIERIINISLLDKVLSFINIENISNKSIGIIVVQVIGLVLFFYLITIIISVIFDNIRFSEFKVIKKGNRLNISYGLINQKEYSIPLDKLHGIRLKQSLFQQIFNLYSIEVITIGYGDETGEIALLYPVANESIKNKIIRELIPHMEYKGEVFKPKRRVIARFIVKRFLVTLAIVTIFMNLLVRVDLTLRISIGFMVILISIIRGYANYRNTSIGVDSNVIIISEGSITKKTTIITQNSVQSISKAEGPLQRVRGICNYKINIYSNSFGEVVTVKNLDNNIMELLDNQLII